MPRILVVEDSLTQAQHIADILIQAGFQVELVADAELGFESLIHQQFDLVLSDIYLPGASGFELCRRIKANPERRAIPVVLLTQWADPVNVLQGLEAGADSFITKGREAEELVQRLNQTLARPRSPIPAGESVRTSISYLGQKYLVAPDQLLDVLLLAFEDQVFLKQQLEAELIERQRAEDSFKAVVESTPSGMIMVDRDGRVVLVNAQTEKLFRYAREELLGQTIETLIPESFRDERKAARQQFFASSEVRAMGQARNLFARRKDGSEFPVEVGVNPVQNHDGPCLLIAVSDITERKRAEAEILQLNTELEQRVENRTRELVDAHRILAEKHRENERSEKRLAGIIRSATDSILTLDEDRRITLFNAAAERTFRCAAVDAVGQPVEKFIRDPDGDLDRILRRPPGDGNPSASWFELQGIRADGEAFPIETSFSSAEITGEQLFIVIIRDITARKRAQDRLKEQATLIDRATNAILIHEPDFRIRFWNQGATRLYGWTAAEAVGSTAEQLIFEGPSRELAEAQQAVIERKSWAGELRQINKEGKEIIVDSRWTLMRDEQGTIRSILSINTDITEKKKLDAQLVRTQRLESLGTLAGGIAHDLNNVLTPIVMGIELLKANAADTVSKSILTTLEASATRGAEMVKQILSFARGTEGQLQPTPLRPVVHDVERMIERTFPKSIEIQIFVPTDLWPVLGDATQLHQVLMNLCVNARDAMPQGGPLTINAENRSLDENFAKANVEAKPGPYVLCTITDQGTGIPADVLERIFDPFFTTKEIGKGTGLGLSTVAGIVKNHGGFVNVYSEVGKGSQFSVYFPAIASADTIKAEEANRRLPGGKGEWILVVDDEAAIREIARVTLEAHAYRVLLANDGAAALKMYLKHRDQIKAVIIDMMMPVMDGPTTIQAIRKLNPEARFIAVSGLAANGKAAKAAGGADLRFVPKPFTAETLLTTLREVLDEGKKNGDLSYATPQ